MLGSNAQAAQIFAGCNSKYVDVYSVLTDHDLSHMLEENIMSHGAMDVLISNNAHTATSQKVKDILHMYHIQSHTSEPHHQHQIYAKCCIGHIKDVTNCVLTFISATSNLWLLCVMYVVYILNITGNTSIGNITPTNIYMDKLPIFLPHSVFAFTNLSTTLILILFLLPLRERGDGVVLPLTLGIFSPFGSLWMIPNALSTIPLSTLPST